jgi:hypothetical protein
MVSIVRFNSTPRLFPGGDIVFMLNKIFDVENFMLLRGGAKDNEPDKLSHVVRAVCKTPERRSGWNPTLQESTAIARCCQWRAGFHAGRSGFAGGLLVIY